MCSELDMKRMVYYFILFYYLVNNKDKWYIMHFMRNSECTHTVSIFYKRKNVQHTSMSGSTVAAYGRAKALDQQDLGHYITKSIIMPNPLIFKCEWESIEQKKNKEKKKSNEKEKNIRKNHEKPVHASRLWVQLCVHIVRKI